VLGAMYAVDCRGHGASGTTPAPFTTARFAQDLVDVMDALALPRVHLVGCSMGGTIALALAGRHPERLASLTVVDTTAWYGPEAPAHWERRAATAEADGMAALVQPGLPGGAAGAGGAVGRGVHRQPRAGLCQQLPHAGRGRRTRRAGGLQRPGGGRRRRGRLRHAARHGRGHRGASGRRHVDRDRRHPALHAARGTGAGGRLHRGGDSPLLADAAGSGAPSGTLDSDYAATR
ncbi:MAG: alpha/beta fold hydrolase, partial [Comamonadaceae bacterium]